MYLGQQWTKVESNLYTPSVYYQPTRLYIMTMRVWNILLKFLLALDIYAEESTTVNEDGFILQIYSESKRIKSIKTCSITVGYQY